MEVVCEYCGKHFHRKASRVRRHNFCSKACCDACPEVGRRKSEALKGHPVSEETRKKIGEANSKPITTAICPVCGVTYTVTAKNRQNKTCGKKECCMAIRGPYNVGKNNYRWKGGTSSHWGRKAKQVVRASGREWKCEVCGATRETALGGLHVHHKNKNRRDVREVNLIILCGSCHSRLHRTLEGLNVRRPVVLPCV